MAENDKPKYDLKKDADLVKLVTDVRAAFNGAPYFYDGLHFRYKHIITPENQNYDNVLKRFQHLRQADLMQVLDREVVLLLSAGKSQLEHSTVYINLTNSEIGIANSNGGGGIEPEKIRESMMNYITKKAEDQTSYLGKTELPLPSGSNLGKSELPLPPGSKLGKEKL